VALPQGHNGLSARRMAVLDTLCEPLLRRHVHREFMRSAVLEVILIIPAFACHQRNDGEGYSRSNRAGHRVWGCSELQAAPTMPLDL
jgi:hypothetical protein